MEDEIKKGFRGGKGGIDKKGFYEVLGQTFDRVITITMFLWLIFLYTSLRNLNSSSSSIQIIVAKEFISY